MFTDGLVERRREHLDIGLARLAGLAASHAQLPPQEFVTTLAASVTQRFDDLALVCVDFRRRPTVAISRADVSSPAMRRRSMPHRPVASTLLDQFGERHALLLGLVHQLRSPRRSRSAVQAR